MNRRKFLEHTPALVALLTTALPSLAADKNAKKKVVLLRSSWQTVNIGDIGHTPGVLTILEKYLPEAEVRLWPSDVKNGVKEIIEKRFPKVTLVMTEEAVKTAFKECDFLLHGSGPFLVARTSVDRWWKETGKPFGVYGITFPGFYGKPTDAQTATLATDTELLSHARFVLFRDSVSLEYAKQHGVKSPVMQFGPDGAFAVDLKDDKTAETFLKEHGLEAGKFLCVIPRTRYTPYWEIPAKKTAFDAFKDNKNKEYEERDNKPLREAMIAVLRNTSLKILVCPEDETQVKLGKRVLVDPLPDDLKQRVVWRDRYWLTDEALSTYTRSAGLFGLEMHSPIMCIGNGIPAIVCRFEEQTSKGFMCKDIGLGDWLFDMDKPEEVARIVPTVLEMAKNPKAAKAKALKAQKTVQRIQKETMDLLRKNLNA